jgi:signal transduction histidine kinase
MKSWSDNSENEKEFTSQYRIINKKGEARWFLTRAVPMCDEDGKIQRWMGTSTDIHDQKELADKLMATEKKLNNANTLLSKKNKRLKNINKDLDNFVYSATHDLRSPISNLEALLKLLQADAMGMPSSEKFIDYFKLVFKSMDIVNVILNDLTEVVKADDEQDAVIDSLSFKEVLEEVKVTLHDSIKSSGAEINVEFEIAEVKFLRKNLRSIFYNLLSNSIKYRSGSRDLIISVSTKEDNEYTLLSIADNGIGIREKDIEKVFLPFKRINYDIEGTGIGMWIMKRIIENSGGKIEVESELDKRTTFKIYFKKSDLKNPNSKNQKYK